MVTTLVGLAPAVVLAAAAPADIVMKNGRLMPESLAAARDGTVYIGTEGEGLYRARRGETEFSPWIKPAGPSPINVSGVLIDDQGALWACMTARGPGGAVSSLRRFALPDGRQTGLFQGPAGSGCNDMAVAASGDVYVTDTQNRRILKLARGAAALVPWANDPRFDFVNGVIAQGDAVFVTSTENGGLYRVGIGPAGQAGEIVHLAAPRALGRPDGMRALGPGRFLIAEIVSNQAATGPVGRATLATVKGDRVDYRILESGLDAPCALTVDGRYVLVIEAKKQYHRDPSLIGKDPGPIRAHFVPLGDIERP